jgi:hypothetical protein
MLNKITAILNNPAYRRLLIALIISGLIHLYLVGGLNLSIPGKAIPSSMNVVLAPHVERKKPVLAQPPPHKRPPPARRIKKQAVKPLAPVPQQPVLTAPAIETPVAEIPIPAEPVAPIAEIASEPVTPIKNDAIPGSVTETAVTKTDDRIDPATLNAPLSVETEFMVTVDGTPGVMRNSYQVNPDGSYILKSTTEAKGFAALFLSGQLVQISEGIVTGKGLEPLHYTYQYGNKADKVRHASFDWAANKLTLETDKKVSTAPLAEGAQDMLSSMYQFMFMPPKERMQLVYTDGREPRTHNYTITGEETLSTKIGELRTVHITTRNTDGDARTELWLAVDYYHLPVKMRKTGKNGSVIEQVVTRSMPEVPVIQEIK